MAGPSLLVRVLTDVSQAAKNLTGVGAAGTKTASGLKSAFGSTLSVLNRTGVLGPFQGAFEGVGQAVDQVKGHLHDVGPAMAGVGAAAAGVGLGLQQFGSRNQASMQQLQAAVQATGHSYDDYAGRVQGAIKHGENFGHTANETTDALKTLTVATNSPAKALQYLGLATDLAAAKHISLNSAATQVSRALNGNTRLFKMYGIQVTSTTTATNALTKAQANAQRADLAVHDAKTNLAKIEATLGGRTNLTAAEQKKLTEAQKEVESASKKQTSAHEKLTIAQQNMHDATTANQKAMQELANRLKGQASAAANTFAGHLDALKARVSDAVASFGTKFGPAITAAGAAMSVTGTAISAGQTAVHAFAEAGGIAGVATKIWTGIQAVFNAVMDANPIMLVVIAIAALIVGIILAYKRFAWFRGIVQSIGAFFRVVFHGILAVVQVVWNWIKKNWPLLLGVITGPIGLAVAFAVTHWRLITNAAKAVWNWIKGTWNTVAGFITRPISAAVAAVRTSWASITSAAKSVWNWIRGAWNSVSSFLSAPFKSASTAISNVLDTIIGWVRGIPGKIASALSGVVSAITAPFRSAWNTIANTLNAIHVHIPGLPGPLAHVFSGATLSLPVKLPVLQQGGFIAAPGLAYLHAAEVVTPANQVPTRTGPVVHIENAHFNEPVDVELFMRKAAWAVKRATL